MSEFKGTVKTLPPDKSISHRAAIIGALAQGTTEIQNYSRGLDNQTTLSVLGQLGVNIKQTPKGNGNEVIIHSNGLWNLKAPTETLNCNNSGSTIRMLSGVLAAQPFISRLIGDESLMKRPMRRVADPLREMGAQISLSETGTAPIEIQGKRPLKPISFYQKAPSAQVKSLIILGALHAEGTTEIIEPIETRNHTELMLGLTPEIMPDGANRWVINGPLQPEAKPFNIPSDPSAACFITALGILASDADICLSNVCLNPNRAHFLNVLRDHGLKLPIENERIDGGERVGDVIIQHESLRHPLKISGSKTIAAIIDELPMLAALSSAATGEFELHDAKELRAKESDRIQAMVLNLTACGYDCEEYEDGFLVKGKKSKPKGTVDIKTFYDHRIAMSFAILDAATDISVSLDDPHVIDVSFPNFYEIINALKV